MDDSSIDKTIEQLQSESNRRLKTRMKNNEEIEPAWIVAIVFSLVVLSLWGVGYFDVELNGPASPPCISQCDK